MDKDTIIIEIQSERVGDTATRTIRITINGEDISPMTEPAEDEPVTRPAVPPTFGGVA